MILDKIQYDLQNKNFYEKSRVKVVKFSNFKIPSDNLIAPSSPISLIKF